MSLLLWLLEEVLSQNFLFLIFSSEPIVEQFLYWQHTFHHHNGYVWKMVGTNIISIVWSKHLLLVGHFSFPTTLAFALDSPILFFWFTTSTWAVCISFYFLCWMRCKINHSFVLGNLSINIWGAGASSSSTQWCSVSSFSTHQIMYNLRLAMW